MASITLKEAKGFLKIHQQAFPEVYKFKERISIPAAAAGHRTSGRCRSEASAAAIFSQDKGVRGYAERQAVNSLIQGSAADLIKLAMIRLDDSSRMSRTCN
jgi:DNA polymerase I-like protein with 3'-5' exonuclease and polymerase domains